APEDLGLLCLQYHLQLEDLSVNAGACSFAQGTMLLHAVLIDPHSAHLAQEQEARERGRCGTGHQATPASRHPSSPSRRQCGEVGHTWWSAALAETAA
ncbi:hypothetical protein P7K49_005710, partial [Saguinus oedipus]